MNVLSKYQMPIAAALFGTALGFLLHYTVPADAQFAANILTGNFGALSLGMAYTIHLKDKKLSENEIDIVIGLIALAVLSADAIAVCQHIHASPMTLFALTGIGTLAIAGIAKFVYARNEKDHRNIKIALVTGLILAAELAFFQENQGGLMRSIGVVEWILLTGTYAALRVGMKKSMEQALKVTLVMTLSFLLGDLAAVGHKYLDFSTTLTAFLGTLAGVIFLRLATRQIAEHYEEKAKRIHVK